MENALVSSAKLYIAGAAVEVFSRSKGQWIAVVVFAVDADGTRVVHYGDGMEMEKSVMPAELPAVLRYPRAGTDEAAPAAGPGRSARSRSENGRRRRRRKKKRTGASGASEVQVPAELSVTGDPVLPEASS